MFLVCQEMPRRDVHNVANHVGVTVAACPGVSQLAAATFRPCFPVPDSHFISFFLGSEKPLKQI